jgi:hypothetical protein
MNAAALVSAVAVLAFFAPAALARDDVTRAVEQFDEIRALAMRGLIRA